MQRRGAFAGCAFAVGVGCMQVHMGVSAPKPYGGREGARTDERTNTGWCQTDKQRAILAKKGVFKFDLLVVVVTSSLCTRMFVRSVLCLFDLCLHPLIAICSVHSQFSRFNLASLQNTAHWPFASYRDTASIAVRDPTLHTLQLSRSSSSTASMRG